MKNIAVESCVWNVDNATASSGVSQVAPPTIQSGKSTKVKAQQQAVLLDGTALLYQMAAFQTTTVLPGTSVAPANFSITSTAKKVTADSGKAVLLESDTNSSPVTVNFDSSGTTGTPGTTVPLPVTVMVSSAGQTKVKGA